MLGPSDDFIFGATVGDSDPNYYRQLALHNDLHNANSFEDVRTGYFNEKGRPYYNEFEQLVPWFWNNEQVLQYKQQYSEMERIQELEKELREISKRKRLVEKELSLLKKKRMD